MHRLTYFLIDIDQDSDEVDEQFNVINYHEAFLRNIVSLDHLHMTFNQFNHESYIATDAKQTLIFLQNSVKDSR